MSEARKYPSWYWTKGLHDAKILEASMRDDALVLHIDSGNAMYDNFVEQIVFLDARLKTPLPAPTKRKPPTIISRISIRLYSKTIFEKED